MSIRSVKVVVKYVSGTDIVKESQFECPSMAETCSYLRSKVIPIKSYLDSHSNIQLSFSLYWKLNGKEHYCCTYYVQRMKDYKFMLDNMPKKLMFMFGNLTFKDED